MHAYLIVGTSDEEKEIEVGKVIGTLNAQRLDFELQKVEDIKALLAFTKTTLSVKSAIVVKNIEDASTETLNAFLKSLEEPQEKLSYILTCRSESRVLPTIVSRCLVIKVRAGNITKETDTKQISDFLSMTTDEKLIRIEKLKDRKEAVVFIAELLIGGHALLTKVEDGKNAESLAKSLSFIQNCYNALKMNGNVGLHLTNLVVNLDSL